MVDANRDPVLSARLDELLAVAGVSIEPVTQRHAEIARQATGTSGRAPGRRPG